MSILLKDLAKYDENLTIAQLKKAIESERAIEKEKEEGLGLPVGVMNDVAQQQMASNIPVSPTHPEDLKAQAEIETQKQKSAAKKEEVNTFTRLKRIL